MAQQNRISLTLDEGELAVVNQAIGTLREKLLPKLTILSAADRHEMPKMGDKTVAFVDKAHDFAAENPSLVPPFLDMNEFTVDRASVEKLRALSIQLNEVSDAVNDSMMLSGSEAYQAALMFYNSSKNAARSGVQNAENVYKELSERFPGRPTKAAAK